MDYRNPKQIKTIELSRIQRLVGRRMLQSKQQKPCFYLNAVADMTDIVKTRRSLGRRLGVPIATNDFIIKAMAMSVQRFVLMAADIVGDNLKIADNINVALAVAAPQGLFVPVIKSAHQKTLAQIAADSTTLINKARSNSLSLEDMQGGCITLTNLAMFGSDSFIAIPLPSQCSILSAGKITEQPVSKNGQVYCRKLMKRTLAADHRIVNGAYAAEFLANITALLAQPQRLIDGDRDKI